ncbi:MAG: type II CAAX prenyl endopeptidase Rce1 family protein [Thermoanaerobaculia bacterium]
MEPDRKDRVVERFLRGSHARQQSDEDGAAEVVSLPTAEELAPQLPQRYLIREGADGRYLTSRETPELKVRLDPGLSVTAAAARKAPEGTIYLDGAAQGEPFLDHERRVFNLDHHEGVIRRFTLSACEQAMILVLRGLDLRERPWTILANQPDLDTVLAIWVLMNSVHLGEDQPEIRRAAMPLIRIEGLIDSQGLELLEFGGMDEAGMQEALDRLDSLREVELAAMDDGQPTEATLLETLIAQLRLLDRMIYPVGFFETLPAVEELALAELTPQRIAVVCRCECGIYESEPVLKRLYGKRLGIIVLQKSADSYTLRQVDTFLPGNLKEAYRTLNLMDPAVRSSRSPNRWGGSGEIGGSPRTSGTRLEPTEIAAACRLAFHRPTPRERTLSAAAAFLLSSLTLLVGWAVAALGSPRLPWTGAADLDDLAAFGGTAVAAGALLLAAFKAFRRPGLFGLRPPAGWSWLWLSPVALAGALLGGAWMPAVGSPSALTRPMMLLTLLLLPAAAEIGFRGLGQGLLMQRFRARGPEGSWLPSWPTVGSAVFFALWSAPLYLAGPATVVGNQPLPFASLSGALLLGLALGMARERAESLLAALALHYLGVCAVILAATLL